MQNQELRIHDFIEGRCPVTIDSMKEIGLSPLEKRAIFFSIQKEIDRVREEVRKPRAT